MTSELFLTLIILLHVQHGRFFTALSPMLRLEHCSSYIPGSNPNVEQTPRALTQVREKIALQQGVPRRCSVITEHRRGGCS